MSCCRQLCTRRHPSPSPDPLIDRLGKGDQLRQIIQFVDALTPRQDVAADLALNTIPSLFELSDGTFFSL
jgi:hypothetical protein